MGAVRRRRSGKISREPRQFVYGRNMREEKRKRGRKRRRQRRRGGQCTGVGLVVVKVKRRG
jgi:hypothetical protein